MAAAPTQRWPWVLALVWICGVATALVALDLRARAQPAETTEATLARVEAWARTVAPEPGVATVVRLATGCHCSALAPGWEAMAARWARHGARTLEAPIDGRPEGLGDAALLLLDRDGRLAFLGPVDAGPGCGPRHPIDLLLASYRADARRPAVVLQSPCQCP